MQHSTPHSVPPPAPPESPSLADIVALAYEVSLGADMTCGFVLGAARVAPGELALHVKALEHHPADALLGFRAPPDWWALVIAGTGTDHRQPPDHRDRRVHFAVGMQRDGTMSAVVGRDTGTVPLTLEHRGVGRLVDVMSRVLDLPTDPAPWPLDTVVHAVWLDRCLEQLIGQPEVGPNWPTLASLHPCADADPAPGPHELRHHTSQLVAQRGWSGLAGSAMEGLGVPSDLVDWFDEGSYSRWVMGCLAPLPVLLTDVIALAPSGLAPLIHETLGKNSGQEVCENGWWMAF